MTNPDREELVKIADEIEAYGFECEGGPLKNCKPWQELKRRLASSEDAVKGEPEPVAWRWRDHSTGVLAPFWQYGAIEPDTYPDREVEPLYTAPPADDGMRPAAEDVLERISAELGVMAESLTDGPSGFADGVVAAIFAGTVRANMSTDIEALTAPGATTKSDEGFLGSLPSGESEPAVTPASPSSDPSSTRSDVTVASLAVWLLDNLSLDASHEDDARALLDQFEIRRNCP